MSETRVLLTLLLIAALIGGTLILVALATARSIREERLREKMPAPHEPGLR